MRHFIRHRTEYAYQPAAGRVALRLKLFPTRFVGHQAATWRVSVNGQGVKPLLTNGYGDAEAIWTTLTPVERLEIVAEGEIVVEDTAGVVRGLVEAARPTVFLRPTPLTKPTKALQDFADRARSETPLASLHAISELVGKQIAYTPGSTQAGTPAGEALEKGQGVCQDHAHVFIAAARLLDTPARYVVGYLADDPKHQAQTHAWAEAFVPDLGWVGFDPANGQCPTEAYVRVACGFDAVDAAPIRGCMTHGVQERLSTDVVIGAERPPGATGAQAQEQ